MRKLYVLISILTAAVLSGCSYLPENDPNYRNATVHDVTIGKTYEPYKWKRDNTTTFWNVIGDMLTGERKMTW